MQTHKKLKEVLYSIIAVCVIVWAIVYVQIKSVVTENVAPPVQQMGDAKREQMVQVSQNLTVQQTDPKLKAKLAEVSAGLNKK